MKEHESQMFYDFNNAVISVAESFTRPHVMMRPKVYLDGNAWCALYCENIAVGVVGFGSSPEEACAEFDKQWINGLSTITEAQSE